RIQWRYTQLDSARHHPMRYAEVAINIAVNKTFHYHIPEYLSASLQIGSLVRVQFGVAMQPAVIIAFHDTTDIPETKPILELLDAQPIMPPEYIELAQWLSKNYLESIGFCVWRMLPPGIIGSTNQQITLLDPKANPRGSLQKEIVDYLRESDGTQRLSMLRTKFKGRSLNATLARLQELGIIERRSFLNPPSIKPKTEQFVELTFPGKHIANIARHIGKSTKKADLLEVIATHAEDPIGIKDALELADVKSRSSLNALIDEGLVFIEKTPRGEQDLIFLEATPETVDETLMKWRGSAPYLRVLNYIA
ncbi:MAG: hypothetical protein CUN54_09200, partial [Phototrophicales bacterium]